MVVTELIVSSTGQWKYTPKVDGDYITSALPSFAVALKDADGDAVTLSLEPVFDLDTTTNIGSYYQTITAAEAATSLLWQQLTVTPTWTDSESRTLSDDEWAIIVDRPSVYGTVIGVQQFYLSLIEFSATSDPITAKQVQDILIARAQFVNMKLAGVGYGTVTDEYPEAKKILDDITEHKAAAEVYRRMNAMREARSGALSQADKWDAHASSMLKAILSGEYVLPDVPKVGSDSGTSAAGSSSRQYSGVSSTSTNTFIDTYGPPDGGY